VTQVHPSTFYKVSSGLCCSTQVSAFAGVPSTLLDVELYHIQGFRMWLNYSPNPKTSQAVALQLSLFCLVISKVCQGALCAIALRRGPASPLQACRFFGQPATVHTLLQL